MWLVNIMEKLITTILAILMEYKRVVKKSSLKNIE